MSVLHSSNPVLNADAFEQRLPGVGATSRAGMMTYTGTITATAVLLGITAATAVFAFGLLTSGAIPLFASMIGGGLAGFVLAIVICFNPPTARFLSFPYAFCEGLFIAGASVVYAEFAGEKATALTGSSIIFQAGLLTFGISGAMLVAYSTRLLRATPAFTKGVLAATGGVVVLMLGTWLLQMFGVSIPWLWDGGPISILICGAIVVIAALNLILDFALVEEGVENGMPKHMEWFAAFGLLVTLVWLYLSILRLLAILNRD